MNTPGPWHVSHNSHGETFVSYTAETGQALEIARVYAFGNAEADAQLIASAPDLLAACEAALAWLNRFGEHSPIAFGGEAEIAEHLRTDLAGAGH